MVWYLMVYRYAMKWRASLPDAAQIYGRRFNRLRAATSVLQREGLLRKETGRQLIRLDTAAALVRHIDCARAQELRAHIRMDMDTKRDEHDEERAAAGARARPRRRATAHAARMSRRTPAPTTGGTISDDIISEFLRGAGCVDGCGGSLACGNILMKVGLSSTAVGSERQAT